MGDIMAADKLITKNIFDTKSVCPSEGGTYLVIADDSEEFPVALHYAIGQARINQGHLGILYAMQFEDFQHWENVESKMRKEKRDQAEKYIWNIAQNVYEELGECLVLYMGEGSIQDVLVNTLENDSEIVQLVLSAQTGGKGPGPLVSYMTAKAMHKVPVPIVIVPAHFQDDNAE